MSEGHVIARPGQSVNASLAELAGVDMNSDLAHRWREQLEGIARAEREAERDNEGIRIR